MNDAPKAAGDRPTQKGANEVDRLVEVAEGSVHGHLLARGFVLGVLVTAAMAVLVVQNTESIGLEWLWFDFEARVWFVLGLAFIAGLIAGPLLIVGWRRSAAERKRRRQVIARFKGSRAAVPPSSATPSGPVPSGPRDARGVAHGEKP